MAVLNIEECSLPSLLTPLSLSLFQTRSHARALSHTFPLALFLSLSFSRFLFIFTPFSLSRTPPHSPSLLLLFSQISAAIEAPQRRISCPASRFVKIPYFSIIIYYRGCREAVDGFWCHFSGSGPVHCCWLCCCCCCCCLQRARTCLLLLLPLVLVLLFLLLLLLLTDRKN